MRLLNAVLTLLLSSYFLTSAFAVPSRSVRRAAYLLAGRLPTASELSFASSSDEGYRSYVRSLIESPDFYDAILRYHELQFGVGLPKEYLEELQSDSFDGTSQKAPTLMCSRGRSGALACGWRSFDKKTVSQCRRSEQQPVAPFWKSGLVLWVCPNVVNVCGSNLSKCVIEFDGGVESAATEIGATDVFDSKRSLLKSLSRQAAGIATAVAVDNYPYTKILAPGLTAVDGVLASALLQKFQLDVEKLHVNQNLLRQLKAVPATQSKFSLVFTGSSYETAGVLTTFGWLRRYEKNRTRANQLYERLMCRKFTSELPRVFPQDPGSLRNTEGCSGCHSILDPLADFFAVWGEGGSLYNATGFGISTTFLGKSGSSLADLSDIITNDEAFAACTVNHAFEWLIGRPFRKAEAGVRERLTSYFIDTNFSFKELMYSIATHPDFLQNSRSDANVTDPLEQPAIGKVPEPSLPECKTTLSYNSDIQPLVAQCTSCHYSGSPRQALETEANWKTWGTQAVSMMSVGQMPPGMQGAPVSGSVYDLKEAVRCWLKQNP